MKTIVAGSRSFNDYDYLSLILSCLEVTQVVSGAARGADTLGERYAKEHKIPIKQFPADWTTHGKRAGYLRNEKMAKYADQCVVFMEKKGTKGSQHMIKLAKELDLKLVVMLY